MTGHSPSQPNMKEVLDFLNSIEGHGYGGMASFEIAREHAREMVRPAAQSDAAGDGPVAGWLVERQSDPTFPRLFRSKEEVDALVKYTTNFPSLRVTPLGRIPDQPQAASNPTDAMIEAAAREIWNDRDARHGGAWDSRDQREVCVIQTKATARAALIAALSGKPGGQAGEDVITDADIAIGNLNREWNEIRAKTIKECAKIADDFAAYEQTVLDREYADGALSESGRSKIAAAAGSRQVAAEQIAHDIRALASEGKKND